MNPRRWHNRLATRWSSPMDRIPFLSRDKRKREADDASHEFTPSDNLHCPNGEALSLINSGAPPAHESSGCRRIPTAPGHDHGEVILECPLQTIINQLLHVVAQAQTATVTAYFRADGAVTDEPWWCFSSCFQGMQSRSGTSGVYASAQQDLLCVLLGELAKFEERYMQVQEHASSKYQRGGGKDTRSRKLQQPNTAREQPKELQAEATSHMIASEVKAPTDLEEGKKAVIAEANAKENSQKCQDLVEKLAKLELSEGQGVKLNSLADQKIQQLELQNQELIQELDNWKQKLSETEDRAHQSWKSAQREIQALRATLDKTKAEKEGLKGQLSKLERLESERGKEVLLSGSYLDTEATPTLVQTMANKVKDTLSSFTKAYMRLEVKDSSSGSASPVDQHAISLQKTVARFPRTSHVKYTFEAAICGICFQYFESATINGLIWEPCLDREKARKESFEEFKQLRATEGDHPHPDTPHAEFCFQRFARIWPAQKDLAVFGNTSCSDLVASRRHAGSEFYDCFVGFATSVWLMHLLCASCEPVATIFKVNPNDDFNPAYMESVAIRDEALGGQVPKVAFMVVPGFRVGKSTIKSQVYLK